MTYSVYFELHKTNPPINTSVIITNISIIKGSMKVYKPLANCSGQLSLTKSKKKTPNGVKLITIYLDANLWYRCLGNARMKYIIEKES